MWVAWNLKGAPDLESYIALGEYDRTVIRKELSVLIAEHNSKLED